MAKDHPISQVGDRWDVVFIIKGDGHDQACALLTCVTFDDAVDYVRHHATDWCCPLSIWPSWAYWPIVEGNDLRYIEMMEVKFKSLKLDLETNKPATKRLRKVGA